MEKENTYLYKSEFTHDLSIQKEMLRASRYLNPIVKYLHIAIIGVLLWFFFMMFFLLDAPEEFSGGMATITILYLVIEGFRLLSHRKGGIQYKRTLLTNGGEPIRCSIQFRESDILSVNLSTDGKNILSYDQINGVYETENLFLCPMKYRLVLIVDKRTLNGSREEFLEFLLSHCPKIRRKKVHSIKYDQIINAIKWATVFVMLAIALFFHPTLQLKQRFSGQIHNGMSVQEVLSELETFGITCEDPEMVENIYGGTFYLYGNRLESILHYIALGTYDYDTESWVPSANGISYINRWTFDAQDTMYTDLFQHITALGGDTLHLTNIQEDHSSANHITNEGSVVITFQLLGCEYTLEAEVQGDLYDIQILNQLNRIVTEQTGKQLYFSDYENMGYFLFYGDETWADSFSRRTGLELVTQLESQY